MSNPSRPGRHCRRVLYRACFLAATSLLASHSAFAQTTVSSAATGSGTWSNPAIWSTNPVYPNNGTPAGTVYDAVIPAAAIGIGIDVTSDTTVRSLAVSGPSSSVSLRSGTFSATNGLSLAAGNSLNFPGSTGTLANTTVTGPGTLKVADPVIYYSPNYGTLDHVTLDTNATGSYTIKNGLTLLNNHTISGFTGISTRLVGNQTISGAGSFNNASLQITDNSTVTIDSGITLNNGGVDGGTATNSHFNINGTLRCDTGASISSYGNTVHINRVEVTGGTLYLGGNLSLSQFSTFAWTGGALSIGGTVNFDRPVTAAGPIQLQLNGSLNGTVAAGPGNPIQVLGNSTLGGHVDADVTVSPGNNLTLTPGSAFNGTISVSPGGTGGSLSLATGGTISGNGQIVFNGTAWDTVLQVTTPSGTFQPGNCTIGPGFTIRTGTGHGGISASGTVTNFGTISAQTPGTYLGVSGVILNQGTLRAINGSTLSSGALINAAGRTVTVDSGGSFSASGGPSIPTTNAGTISVSDGGLTLGNYWTNTGTITATNSNVSFGGTWSNTGSIAVNGGTLTLYGDAPSNTGTLSVSSATVTLAGADPMALALGPANPFTGNAIRVAASYTTAQLLAVPLAGNSSVTIVPGGVINNAGATFAPTASPPWSLAGGAVTGGTLAAPDDIPLPVTALANTFSAVSVLSPVVVQNAASLLLDGGSNASTVTVNSGATLSVANSFTNAGAVNLLPGSTLAVNGPFSASSPLAANGATVLLPGNTAAATFSPAQVTSLINPVNSTLRVATGGTLDLAGGALAAAPGGSTWDLYGGTLANGTLATPVSASATPSPSIYETYGPPSTLTNVTIASDLSIGTGSTIMATGTVLAPGARIRFSGSVAYYTLSGTTLDGAGDVIFDGNTGYLASDASPLTIAPAITVRTGAGSGVVGSYNQPLTNLGTLSAETPGRALTLTGSSFTNSGSLVATNGGTLAFGFPNLTPAAFANLNVSNGGKVRINGTLNNTGNTLALSTPAFPLIVGGVINGGSVTTSDDTHLIIDGYASLNSVDVDAPVDVVGFGPFTATSTTFRKPLTVTGTNGNYGATFAGNTTASAVSVSGSSLALSGSWNITGSLAVANNSTLYVYTPPAAPLAQPASVTNSSLVLFNGSAALLNSFVRTNSPTTLTGTFTNTGNTLAPTDVTGPVRLGTSFSTSATLVGGTIATTAPGQFILSNSFVTLSNATLHGFLTTADVAPTVAGSITLDDGHISLAPTFNSGAGLRFSGAAATIAGTGDITFDGAAPSTLAPALSSDKVSLAAGVTLRTGTQGGSATLSTVDGTISAQTAGKTVTLSATTVNGTLQAANGGTLALTTIPSNYTPATGKLTGGTYTVSGASALNFPPSVNVTTNAGSITLDGISSRFTAVNSLRANVGSLTLTNGRTLTTSSIPATFTNTGSITLGPSAGLKVRNALANPGTITLTGGSLLIDYTTTSPLDTLRNDLLTGHLTTPGPNTAIAYFEASQLNLTTYAGFAVDATTLLTKLTVPGDANLDGKVSPDDYALLDRSLAKSLANAHWTDGDFNYDGTITPADYLLIDSTYLQQQGGTPSPAFLSTRESQFGADYVSQLLVSIPEPSLLAGCGLTLLLPARRSRK